MRYCNFALLLTVLFSSSFIHAAKVSDTWTVFGSYRKLEHTLPASLANGIPEQLRVSNTTLKAVKAAPRNGKIDFQKIYKKALPRRAFYVCIPIESG